MRLTTVRVNGGTSAGRVQATRIELLPYADVGALLASGIDLRAVAEQPSDTSIDIATADFAPLILAPEKIFCIGANYRDHLDEIGLPAPQYPSVFAKFSRALIGANDPIQLPANSDCVDWEVELGVVVGRAARHVNESDALDAVAGYTIINDVSMRDWQVRTSQFLQGKTFERCTPIGPFLVTPDEVDHAQRLEMTCCVDGHTTQRGCSEDMLFGVAHIVAYLSSIITLVPGDVIATGTPGGVGAFHKPPRYLGAGQVLTTAIEGLGDQTNQCVAS